MSLASALFYIKKKKKRKKKNMRERKKKIKFSIKALFTI